MRVMNKTTRVISVGGVSLVPGQPADVPEGFHDNANLKALLDDGSLEVEEGGSDPKPAGSKESGSTSAPAGGAPTASRAPAAVPADVKK